MAYKLTPETTQKIFQAIQMGATYELAASYAGITYNTLYNWMKKGEAAKSGKFKDFVKELKEAEGKAAIGWLAKIEKAGSEGDWRAVAWKLERRYPEDYGRQVRELRHQGHDGGPLIELDDGKD